MDLMPLNLAAFNSLYHSICFTFLHQNVFINLYYHSDVDVNGHTNEFCVCVPVGVFSALGSSEMYLSFEVKQLYI